MRIECAQRSPHLLRAEITRLSQQPSCLAGSGEHHKTPVSAAVPPVDQSLRRKPTHEAADRVGCEPQPTGCVGDCEPRQQLYEPEQLGLDGPQRLRLATLPHGPAEHPVYHTDRGNQFSRDLRGHRGYRFMRKQIVHGAKCILAFTRKPGASVALTVSMLSVPVVRYYASTSSITGAARSAACSPRSRWT